VALPFTLSARGKTQELRTELQQADKKDKGFAKKKIALKKVIANMTMGNDSEFRLDVVWFCRWVWAFNWSVLIF
jgi:vesicle coat complex subunit